MVDVPKLNGVEHEILKLLTQRTEMYGLEMVKASSSLKRGSVYVVLGRMEDKGWIRSRPEDEPNHPGLVRRLYSIAAPGELALRAVSAAERVYFDAVPVGI